MNAKIPLPSFKEGLALVPAAPISQVTRWRYSNGDLPRSLLWLLAYPQLLRALAADAEALAADRVFQSPTEEQPTTE